MNRLGGGAAVLFALAGHSSGQTANELRDPKYSVFRAFPEADAFRTIVRDVDQKARAEVEKRLPFKVHFNELGPHAVYVAFRGRKPLGMMYQRTEQSAWGLAEIGWSLTLDLRVTGFRFHRLRGTHGGQLSSSPFARGLVGRGFADLEKMLAEQTGPAAEWAGVPAGAEELAHTVLRSALMTILVTEVVWRDELTKLQDLAMGFEAFPSAERFKRQVLRFSGDEAGSESVRAVHVMRARGKGHADLGVVLRTEAQYGKRSVTLRWVLTPDLHVTRIVPARAWDDVDLRVACNELIGQSLLEASSDHTEVAKLVAQVATLLVRLQRRGHD